MNLVKQLLWILAFCFFGEAVAVLLQSPIPGSVIGMVTFFIALRLKVVTLEKVDTVGSWLVQNMGIFFIPGGVGLITHLEVLQANFIPLLALIIISTGVTIAVVAFSVQRLSRANKEASK